MKNGITREFIRAIPKTDLHLHLDGSLRLGTLVELAERARIPLPAHDEAGLKKSVFKAKYKDLPDYLQGFHYTCAVMRTPENIERIAFELAEDNIAENVRYIEVRFAPQLHITDGLSVREILKAVHAGLDRAKRRHNESAAVREGTDLPFEYGIIVCAMRRFFAGMSDYYAKLFSVMQHAPLKEVYATASLDLARASVRIRDEDGLPIVGFDLAGEEAGFPAGNHVEAYRYAHRHFMKKTVHAGEAYGPESIFQAITACHANRIGHGTFIFASNLVQDDTTDDPQRYTRQLAEYIASERIALEVCPTSNLQTTPELKTITDHPLQRMIESEMSVCVCTDNRLVSNTTVTDELALVAENLPISRHQFRNLVVAGFKGSFYPGSYARKRAYVRDVMNRYDRLERDLLPPDPADAPYLDMNL